MSATSTTTNTSNTTSREIPDLREGGTWSFAQRVKNAILYVLIISTLAIAERLPRSTLRVVGRAIGFLAWALVPSLKRIATENVSRAMPELDSKERASLVRRTYRELGWLLGDTVATLDPRRAIEPLPFLPGARECLDEAIAEGHGVVFASAHLGPWERVAASLVQAGVPLTVVAREPYDPRLARVYERLRGGRNVKAIYRGSKSAGVALVRVLRKGGVLGVPMDLASRAPSIDVPFLGVPGAPTATGPARLALRTGAAVVVGAAAPGGIAFTRINVVASSDDELTLTTRINDALSDRIRAMPEAWPWMHARWRWVKATKTASRKSVT